MSKITVATFNEQDKAEIVKKRLEEAGMRAEVYDESAVQKFWFFSEPFAGKRLRVDEKDFDKARELLEGLDAKEDLLHDAIKCPQCGSSRIEYPQFTRKFITPTLVEIFCTLHIIDKEFYCQNCQYTWPLKEKAQPELDVLNWPLRKESASPPPSEPSTGANQGAN